MRGFMASEQPRQMLSSLVVQRLFTFIRRGLDLAVIATAMAAGEFANP
jgi:hypothetical protein